MSALGMILKGLGVNVSDEHVKQIEILLPQLPSRMQQTVEVINAAVDQTHSKLDRIQRELEQRDALLCEMSAGIRRLSELVREQTNHARGNGSAHGKRGSNAANGSGR